MKSSQFPPCFLFDNGSLRAASTLNLRAIAATLKAELGAEIFPVSLLHSSGVDAGALAGEKARLLEPALVEYLAANECGEVVVLPLFFGPSGALTEYVPERVWAILGKFPQAKIIQAGWLVQVEEGDAQIAQILADAAVVAMERGGFRRPKVILVDHGSPQREVAAVRDHLGAQVREILGEKVGAVGVASMERRPGAAYDFNEPLLETLLATAPFNEGEVVVLLQFLSPGRHAGAGGDIAQICAAAKAKISTLRIEISDTIGGDVRLAKVLARRYREALNGSEADGDAL